MSHLGLIVPPAEGLVPPEAPQMYPRCRFTASGLGLREMSDAGYSGVIDAVAARAEGLVREGAQAVSVMGTSLSFFRGPAFNARLIRDLQARCARPATTMTQSVVDALTALGLRRVAVLTAYRDDVNRMLVDYLAHEGIAVTRLQALGIRQISEVHQVGPELLLPEAEALWDSAPASDGMLISCGGLKMAGVSAPLRQRCGLPVVSSAEAGVWGAMRLLDPQGAGSAETVFGAALAA
jgi:arylmalonate decarboxylase